MNKMNISTGMTCGLIVLAAVVGIAVLGVLFNLGSNMSGDVSYTSVLIVMAIIFALIIFMGKRVSQNHPEEQQIIEDRKTALNTLTNKCNLTTDLLEECYKRDTENETKNVKERKEHYSQLYNENVLKFHDECNKLKKEWAQMPRLKTSKFWNWALGLGLLSGCAGSSFTLGLSTPPESPKVALMDSRSWSGATIPMPHMEDHSLYVSDPDSILSPSAVDSINAIMGRLDDNLDIESAVVIVGHIEGDEPVTMVRDIYDKYKVGRNDRGLVIVVGYLDHSYFIAPGRSLEGDLTDLECNHLAQDYLIPSMKAEMPDSGMVYLARGIYALMAGKEMPQMSALTSSSSSDEDDGGILSLILGVIMFCVFGFYSANKSSKTEAKSTVPLKANPFYTPPVITSSSHSSSSSRSGRSSWGGSSGRSGGYGGGSWGGGGSGGRW